MKKRGMSTLQVTLIMPLIFCFIAICYDYIIFLNCTASAVRSINEYKQELVTYLNMAPSEYINAVGSFERNLSPKIRNEKSLFDIWHIGLKSGHLTEVLRAKLKADLKGNLKSVEELDVQFNSYFLKNKCTLKYKLKVNGIFSNFKVLELLFGEDFRTIKGDIVLYQDNIYSDIISIDLIGKELSNIDVIDDFASNFRDKFKEAEKSLN